MSIKALVIVIAALLPVAATASGVSLGAGKALNNTNASLPGYVYSASANYGHLRAGYLRMGKSQVGEDAAITTIGYSYSIPHRPISLSLSAIAGASYSAAVWWDKDRPHESCGVEGCGKRYDNDGKHFSRACHMCGGVISLDYDLGHGLGLRGEYYGLRHMTPTFQGVIVQLTYSIGHK